MQEAVDPAAPGQDERLQRWQISLTAVHESLEFLHLPLAHAEHAFIDGFGWRRQLAAEVEQLILDLAEDLVEPAVTLALVDALRVEDADQADDGIQLVDRAVGDDSRRVLRDSLAADQG